LTLLWRASDFYDVKISNVPSFKFELPVMLIMALILFLISNRRLWSKLNALKRNTAIASLIAAITAAWFFISLDLVPEFHLLIGHSL
jgi:uncharacterized membrane protein YkvA (DUF1232 family)